MSYVGQAQASGAVSVGVGVTARRTLVSQRALEEAVAFHSFLAGTAREKKGGRGSSPPSYAFR